MELPLRLPPAASCGLLRFLAAKKKSAKEIHEELCQVSAQDGYQKCSLQTTSGSELKREFLAFHGTTEEEFLDSIVTGDETWVHYTQKQRSNRSSGKPFVAKAKKFKQILSAGKIMASIFGIERAYCCEFIRGQQSMLTGTVRP
ncbi:hypothetical protein TNCV_2308341 [Trichonephila clavipes]|nr:hypothetical protein TNCV_2308341 [Trichonephila clavipes]